MVEKIRRSDVHLGLDLFAAGVEYVLVDSNGKELDGSQPDLPKNGNGEETHVTSSGARVLPSENPMEAVNGSVGERLGKNGRPRRLYENCSDVATRILDKPRRPGGRRMFR